MRSDADAEDVLQDVLLLVGFVGSDSIVVLAIVALGAHVSRVGLRIVRAIESGSEGAKD